MTTDDMKINDEARRGIEEMAQAFLALLDDAAAQNFVEMILKDSNDVPVVIVTLQRPEGLSPQKLVQKLKVQNLLLRDKLMDIVAQAQRILEHTAPDDAPRSTLVGVAEGKAGAVFAPGEMVTMQREAYSKLEADAEVVRGGHWDEVIAERDKAEERVKELEELMRGTIQRDLEERLRGVAAQAQFQQRLARGDFSQEQAYPAEDRLRGMAVTQLFYDEVQPYDEPIVEMSTCTLALKLLDADEICPRCGYPAKRHRHWEAPR